MPFTSYCHSKPIVPKATPHLNIVVLKVPALVGFYSVISYFIEYWNKDHWSLVVALVWLHWTVDTNLVVSSCSPSSTELIRPLVVVLSGRLCDSGWSGQLHAVAPRLRRRAARRRSGAHCPRSLVPDVHQTRLAPVNQNDFNNLNT